MNTNTVPIILPSETSKSPFVVTENVDVESIKILDMVKVRLTDRHGNGERIWMVVLEMKVDETNEEDIVLTGRIMHDLVVFDFIPKHTVIEMYRSEVIDHVPFDVLRDTH
jgi:hypothetical protein